MSKQQRTEPKAPPVQGWSIVRDGGLWKLLYLSIPAEDVPLYVAKESAPDLLSMLIARVENELHRLPENG